MFDWFKRLATKASADELRAALASIEIAPLEEALTAAEKARAGLLLTGTDAQVLAAEDAIAKARIALDRARAMQEEISVRIVDAERQAREDAFAAKHAAAVDANRALVRRLNGEVAKAARVIDAALTSVEEVEGAQADVVREIIRNVGEGNAIEKTVSPPSLHEWLRDADDETMPPWCRSLIYQRVQARQFI